MAIERLRVSGQHVVRDGSVTLDRGDIFKGKRKEIFVLAFEIEGVRVFSVARWSDFGSTAISSAPWIRPRWHPSRARGPKHPLKA
jgi:hypothetical protein